MDDEEGASPIRGTPGPDNPRVEVLREVDDSCVRVGGTILSPYNSVVGSR